MRGDQRRWLPIGSVHVTWTVREDRTGSRDPIGQVVYDQWPKPGTVCNFHPEQIQGHHYGGHRWVLQIGGLTKCEMCAAELFLDGEAVLDDLARFERMVGDLEALGRSRSRAGWNPPLARLVADTAGRSWGSRTTGAVVRAFEVAALHPGRRGELAAALESMSAPVEYSEGSEEFEPVDVSEPVIKPVAPPRPGPILAPMSTEWGRRSLRR